MPDQLETRLRAERDRLDIDQPPLSVIAARAGALRRRRRAVQGTLAAALLLSLGGALLTTREDRPPPPAQATTGAWTAEGITINGLPHLPTDLPGTVRDVEFADPDRGFLLSATCENPSSCTNWISTTLDGGHTWRSSVAPGRLGATSADKLPSLYVTGSAITLLGPDATGLIRASSEDGETWQVTEAAALTTRSQSDPPLAGDAHLVALGPQPCGRQVAGLTATGLTAVPQPPPISVCWTAPVRAGDGAWWVGGTADGRPAVAVSRDGGTTWQRTLFSSLPEGSGQARVSMQGRDVFAVLVDPTATPAWLIGVAVSDDGGATFGPVRPTAGQATIGGDLVPLLDGRLLLVDGVGHWLVSDDRGTTWHRLDGLHQTTRLARTQSGYVAYGMATIYTAFSVDGTTWQKLDCY